MHSPWEDKSEFVMISDLFWTVSADSHMHYRMSDLCEHNYSEHTKCEHNHSENKDDERPVQLWVSDTDAYIIPYIVLHSCMSNAS